MPNSTAQLCALRQVIKPTNMKKSRRKTNKKIEKCKKWLRATNDMADEYHKTTFVHCDNCCRFSKQLCIIHLEEDEIGDYICTVCNKDVSLCYFCLKCKSTIQADSDDEL